MEWDFGLSLKPKGGGERRGKGGGEGLDLHISLREGILAMSFVNIKFLQSEEVK